MSLVNRLQEMRDAHGGPITITSGVRCAEHNATLPNSAEDSEHVPKEGGDGEGADLLCDDSGYRHELVRLAHEKFARVGIGDDFIHVGVRSTKDQEVTWVY